VEVTFEPEDPPDTFLVALGERLSEQDGIDANLARILKAHILTIAPAEDAVAKAKEAILKLANERTHSTQQESFNE
jgi:hypothetical protein